MSWHSSIPARNTLLATTRDDLFGVFQRKRAERARIRELVRRARLVCRINKIFRRCNEIQGAGSDRDYCRVGDSRLRDIRSRALFYKPRYCCRRSAVYLREQVTVEMWGN